MTFLTLNIKPDAGRIVYGGGGIVPDYIIQPDTSRSGYLINFAIRKRVAFDYVRDYFDNNGDTFRTEWENDFDNFRTNFTWSDEEIQEFKSRMINEGLVIDNTITTPIIEMIHYLFP